MDIFFIFCIMALPIVTGLTTFYYSWKTTEDKHNGT